MQALDGAAAASITAGTGTGTGKGPGVVSEQPAHAAGTSVCPVRKVATAGSVGGARTGLSTTTTTGVAVATGTHSHCGTEHRYYRQQHREPESRPIDAFQLALGRRESHLRSEARWGSCSYAAYTWRSARCQR